MINFFTLEFFFRLLASFFGTVGFSVIFGLRPKHIMLAGVGGLGAYAVYYTCGFFGASLFPCAFMAAVFAALYSEISARLHRAPTAIFLIPCGIPIVPGGDLYYTMRYLLEGDFEKSVSYLTSAFKIGIGMAGGIVAVSVIWRLIFSISAHYRKLKKAK